MLQENDNVKLGTWRFYFVLFLLFLILAGVFWRLIDLNFLNRVFLLKQSEARILRVVDMPAHRGMITDRLGSVLALSTPVYSAWINPKLFSPAISERRQLAHILGLSTHDIMFAQQSKKTFVYLKRQNPPDVMQKIMALQIPGIYFQVEYKRFYPEGEVAAHVIGLTNVDDQGQEGLELAYNQWLAGVPGKKEVLKDRLGHVIADLNVLKQPQQGHDLTLSIDHRIQYAAYRALKEQIETWHAKAGSVVVLNAKTGEILAMVNQPSYNPNNRPVKHDGRYRNRAVTDSFEPGSTMKPFTIALALQSGKYKESNLIDTNPGSMKIGGYFIRDDLNYGIVNLTQILQYSSNIGAAKILLSLSPTDFWNLLRHVGFGDRTSSGFPGESPGKLEAHTTWYSSDVATMAYGYGVAVTALQLAKAYEILANGGWSRPVTFLKQSTEPPARAVMPSRIANQVAHMLESVITGKGGTGSRAAVPGYRVAGKTGTAYIAEDKGYNKKKFVASFVGLAPVSNPQLVIAVVIRDPQKQHFGAIIAAPVFSQVMSDALRILDIPPDNLPS